MTSINDACVTWGMCLMWSATRSCARHHSLSVLTGRSPGRWQNRTTESVGVLSHFPSTGCPRLANIDGRPRSVRNPEVGGGLTVRSLKGHSGWPFVTSLALLKKVLSLYGRSQRFRPKHELVGGSTHTWPAPRFLQVAVVGGTASRSKSNDTSNRWAKQEKRRCALINRWMFSILWSSFEFVPWDIWEPMLPPIIPCASGGTPWFWPLAFGPGSHQALWPSAFHPNFGATSHRLQLTGSHIIVVVGLQYISSAVEIYFSIYLGGPYAPSLGYRSLCIQQTHIAAPKNPPKGRLLKKLALQPRSFWHTTDLSFTNSECPEPGADTPQMKGKYDPYEEQSIFQKCTCTLASASSWAARRGTGTGLRRFLVSGVQMGKPQFAQQLYKVFHANSAKSTFRKKQ